MKLLQTGIAFLLLSWSGTGLSWCGADAVRRLRAEYLYELRSFRQIDFYTEQGIRLNFAQWAAARKVDLSDEKRRRAGFDAYLQTVLARPVEKFEYYDDIGQKPGYSPVWGEGRACIFGGFVLP